jgi:hypothetical protein
MTERPSHYLFQGNGMESVMKRERLLSGLLSSCGPLLVTLGRSCRSYILNDEAEQNWGTLAWMEAAAERRARQDRQAPQLIIRR